MLPTFMNKREVEAGAFVSPKAVPQMADSAEVFAAITRAPGVTYSALVPNEKGYEAARAAEDNPLARVVHWGGDGAGVCC